MCFRIPLLFIVLVVVMALAGGCTVKRMARQAGDFEAAGMFREAADLYYQAVLKKPNAVDFRIGLRRSGQLYVEDLSSGIAGAYSRGDYRKTVYDYVALQEFVNRVKRAGIELDVDYSTRRMYENATANYLNERYETGQRLIGENNFEEARRVFTEIHRLDPDFRDTRSYLTTATHEPVYQNGIRLFGQKRYMEAYREWERIASANQGYRDVKQLMQQALAERYKEGTLMLMEENFDAAAKALGDVFRVNANYEDVRVQYLEARNEPVYRRAKESLAAGRCRTAYYSFEDILTDAGEYKDVRKLQAEAFVCAQFPVAVLTGAIPGNRADGAEFETTLLERILREQNPFVTVHRISGLSMRSGRPFSISSGTPDQSQLRELQSRHGIKAVLVINFSDYRKVDGRLEKTEKTGFERQPVRSTTGETTYHDRKVTYLEYQKTNEVVVAMSYQLISTDNGRVLISQRLNGNESDHLHYAVYDGDQQRLYPAIERNNVFSVDDRNYSNLQRLLRADARIIPADKLRDRVFSDITGQIARAVNNFNPEK